MSYLRFVKMHGAGNDFIVVDQTLPACKFTPDRVRSICDRCRGIGADGLILLAKSRMPSHEGDLIQMEFFNRDGSRASLCGNGLRCAAAFAAKRAMAKGPDIHFLTGSGVLRARVLAPETVRIELPCEADGFRKVTLKSGRTVYFGRVGVPHAVLFVEDPNREDVNRIGCAIRYDEAFAPEGTNVDFLPEQAVLSKPVVIRTYERGVEAETLACGTGMGASASVLHQNHPDMKEITFLTRSGDILKVEFPDPGNERKTIFLTGPAVELFHGATEAFDLE